MPGNAAAVDHVTLFVSPTTLSQPGWKLSAAVVGPNAPLGARDLRDLAHPQARQRARGGAARTPRCAGGHGLLRRPQRPLAGALRHGRCDRHDPDRDRAGAGARRVAGLPRRIREHAGERCAAASSSARGRAFFGTIRRLVLSGSVTFNRGGPVDCSAAGVQDLFAVVGPDRGPPGVERPGGDAAALARTRAAG